MDGINKRKQSSETGFQTNRQTKAAMIDEMDIKPSI